jgi:hypothetical protein
VNGAKASFGHHQNLISSLADGLSRRLEDGGGSGHGNGGCGVKGEALPVRGSFGWAEQDRARRQGRSGFAQVGLGALDHGGHQRRVRRHVREVLRGRVAGERGQHGHLFLGQGKLAHQEDSSWRDDGGRAHQGGSFPSHSRYLLKIPAPGREASFCL